jgi:hypothetical protein
MIGLGEIGDAELDELVEEDGSRLAEEKPSVSRSAAVGQAVAPTWRRYPTGYSGEGDLVSSRLYHPRVLPWETPAVGSKGVGGTAVTRIYWVFRRSCRQEQII